MSDRWHDVALAKLTAVLGAPAAIEHVADGLGALGLEKISTVDELQRFAQHLSTKGGFAGAVGGLLSVHATIHGARLDS